MAGKRPLMDVSELVPTAPDPGPPADGWEATATVYARIPAVLYEKLRRRAFEMSEGKRRRVTQQDVLVAALKAYLGES